jgi:hypothetical protein
MPTPPQTLLDQYKSYIADVGNIGSRYATAQTFYLSVVSALIAVVSLTVKDVSAFQKFTWLIISFVMFFIALICFVWWRTLTFYGNLFAAKFTVLKAMEDEVEGNLFKMFAREWQELEKIKTNKKGPIELPKHPFLSSSELLPWSV